MQRYTWFERTFELVSIQVYGEPFYRNPYCSAATSQRHCSSYAI
jgi:hypothetical protein